MRQEGAGSITASGPNDTTLGFPPFPLHLSLFHLRLQDDLPGVGTKLCKGKGKRSSPGE